MTLASQSPELQVIVGTYAWHLTGVNVFITHLVRGLLQRGVPAKILLTEHATDLVQLPTDMMPFPKDLPMETLPVSRAADWATHWVETVRYLKHHAPCVFLPTSDYRHSCVSPKLPADVHVVGTIQGDDPLHYEHFQRLAEHWDATVCVSSACLERAAKVRPEHAERIVLIPNGVSVPEACATRSRGESDPLRIIYHGVLNQHQKRILDLPKIMECLVAQAVPFQVTIAGSGPEEEILLSRCSEFLAQGRVRFLGLLPSEQIAPLLAEHDAYVLMSAFEGMPHSMLEAMAHGCVPVVSDIPSGVRDVVIDGWNGWRVEVGNVAQFACALKTLQSDPAECQRLAANAHHSVRQSQYTVESMVESYLALFGEIQHAVRIGKYRRPPGRVLPPPRATAGLSIFPVESAGYVETVDRILDGDDAGWRLWRGLSARLKRTWRVITKQLRPDDRS